MNINATALRKVVDDNGCVTMRQVDASEIPKADCTKCRADDCEVCSEFTGRLNHFKLKECKHEWSTSIQGNFRVCVHCAKKQTAMWKDDAD